jgi:imidazolonepropionase-like amidohydrolase
MLPVVEGAVPLVVTVDRAADILAALALAEEQQIRLVLGGAAEGWRVAPAIARAKAPVLVDVDQSLPDSFDTLGARFDNAARLHRAGVVVGFSSAGATHDLRLLRQLAGIAAAWGLPREAALRGLTAVPAGVFGLQDRGVLRPGARANLVVWSDDPLELSSRVTDLIVGGKQLPLASRQTLLRQRYLQLPPSR